MDAYQYRPRGCPPAIGNVCVAAFDMRQGRRIVEPCKDLRDAFTVREKMERDRKLQGTRIEPLS